MDGEIIRGVVQYAIEGASQVLSVFHWQQVGAASDAEVLADLTEWTENSWGSRWADIAAIGAAIVLVSLDVVSEEGLVLRDLGQNVLDVPGIVNSSTQPGAVSTMIFAPTIFPKTRGRKFVPGVSEQGIEAGRITPAVLLDLAVLALPYISEYFGLVAASYVPGVLSTTRLIFVPFIESIAFDDVPDYIRRRRPDRGS